MSAGSGRAGSRSCNGDRGGGELAIVLHTHMPYVEGFGTWPFGEEWLWEAIVGSYLPLLEVLDSGAPLTLSLTPVLCDQLEAFGLAERFTSFVEEVRRATHASDAAGLRAAGEEQLAQELERAGGDYERALDLLGGGDGELLRRLAAHAQWTSSATHAILPLLASDPGVALQVRSGIDAHRRRFGGWRGGFWLPECAYAPWLEDGLHRAGVRASCVELSRQLAPDSWQHLRPAVTDSGLLLVPIDRATISLVWSGDGYPAGDAYRDYHHLTTFHHNPWCNAGGPYRHEQALAQARADAADFVTRTRARLRRAQEEAGEQLPDGGLVVCALDTELLGHWWYEGVAWLEAVVAECARQGLALSRLDDALERHEPWLAAAAGAPPVRAAGAAVAPEPVRAALADWRAGSWGAERDLSTWSAPVVADLAFAARAAELEVVRAGSRAGTAAVRELLALQSSDWPFLISRRLAESYGRERFAAHRESLARELAAAGDGSAQRNIAVDAHPAFMLAP